MEDSKRGVESLGVSQVDWRDMRDPLGEHRHTQTYAQMHGSRLLRLEAVLVHASST